MRLNVFISKSGLTSRRKADALIFDGKIKVNHQIVTNPATQVDENKDIVTHKNQVLKIENYKYFIFHKPLHVVSTMKDPQKRKTVHDFFKHEPYRLFPVGRLDYDSTGLLFMTNDGDFYNKLMHPSKNKNKIYLVEVTKSLTPQQIKQFKKGLVIEGKKTSHSNIQFVTKSKHSIQYKVTIHEGMNRQIRKMFKIFHSHVLTLKRVEISGVKLQALKEGHYRELTQKEYNKLMEIK